MTSQPKLKICLTGATGFIGKALLEILKKREDVEVTALSRKIPPLVDGAKKGNVVWKRCNGFSLIDVENAVEGADVLIYLIHSMMPASALTQGSFSDFDLYLADNFARGCKTKGVKKIIYLSGIIPEGEELSPHLESRLEVERALSQYGNDVTSFRAGLIIGEQGSSFTILERLVKRLPGFILPAWTRSKCQPIDIKDVLLCLEYSLNNFHNLNSSYDIGGDEVVSYREMLKKTAEVMGKKRPSLNVPYFSPRLSKFWVSRVTSTSANLVYPLVESLKHNMVAREGQRLIPPGHNFRSFTSSLQKGITKQEQPWVWRFIDYTGTINIRWLENVTSIQRIQGRQFQSSDELSSEYFKWLSNFFGFFISVKQKDNLVQICTLGSLVLIEMEKNLKRSDELRTFYYIKRGLLAGNQTLNGRMEFRIIPSSNCSLSALLDFRPALPWFIYKYTQALVHLFVMKSFSNYLGRKK